MTSDCTANELAKAALAYPRTGKRGVPQQFPRRLYEMLQSEAHLAETDANHQDIISWSDSGKAFRIVDVSRFSAEVLPKYFRTSKFSSFQRNLNLYGFSKVRRGPDLDMYAHSSFVRGEVENLALLRKSNSTAARKKLATSSLKTMATAPKSVPFPTQKITIPVHVEVSPFTRAVSPSPPRMSTNLPSQPPAMTHFQWQQTPQVPTVSPQMTSIPGSGKLDLLAFALSSMADRDFKFTEHATAVRTA